MVTKPQIFQTTQSGCTFYYKDVDHKYLHRKDGPAALYNNGGKEWWVNGKRHRDNGPAIITALGSKSWYTHGRQHRDGGPAVIWFDGEQEWHHNGKLHRLDGPAREWKTMERFFVNGVEYTAQQFPKAVANYISYVEITKRELQAIFGDYRVVEW